MRDATFLIAVFAASYLGLAQLALSQPRHWRLFAGSRVCPVWLVWGLRLAGGAAIFTSLCLALARDGAGFGSLVWGAGMSVAALAVTATLTWRMSR